MLKSIFQEIFLKAGEAGIKSTFQNCSREYHIDEDWKAVIQKYLNKRKLTKEMVEAFVDRVEVHEDANIVVHLIYDDVLESLKSLSAEREGGANG